MRNNIDKDTLVVRRLKIALVVLMSPALVFVAVFNSGVPDTWRKVKEFPYGVVQAWKYHDRPLDR